MEANPPMVHVGDHGMIFMHYTYHKRCIEARKNDQSSGSLIIEDAQAKHPRIKEGEVEKLNNLKFITTTVLEHKPCSG